jgi:hypothetical protein
MEDYRYVALPKRRCGARESQNATLSSTRIGNPRVSIILALLSHFGSVRFLLTRGLRGAKFRSVSKAYGSVSIVLGLIFFFAGALDVRAHFGVWALSSIMLGLFLIVFGTSFLVADRRKKSTRRVSFAFLGVALVFLAVALVRFL